ncbi:MAG TPA: hypothetical protein GX734_00275 [Clostridiaceae bacterium]|jgi:hypothetical protein|nr:hypothetical protein [Clostridiaceae bacterium]
MKRKSLMILLVCEACLLITLALLPGRLPAVFSSILAFPFEQIALGLKALSQAGNWGNGIAVSLWIGMSLIPAIFALSYREKKAWPERIALFALSCVLLLALYGLVNPYVFSVFNAEAKSEYLPVVKAALGVSVWSVAILYIVLRLIRLFRSSDKASLLRHLRVLLHVLCVIFAASAVYPLATGLVDHVGSSLDFLDGAVNVIRLLIAAVPDALVVAVVIRVLDLLEIAMTEEQVGIVKASERLSGMCCVALCLTTALTATINVLQVILMRSLSNVAIQADVPVINIVFLAFVLLLSRLLVENKELREDNSLFI